MLALGINKSWWEGLSNSDKLLIKAAAHTENDVMMSEYNAKNGSSLDKLIREQGVQLKRFNDDVYELSVKHLKKYLMKLEHTAILQTAFMKVLPKHVKMWGAG
ncbi:MAG: hypothetical protein CM1200mP30_24120 [Pseudomonadota bacterium]|nr:MAG: hypothetical protein CM1200mP30_24120 [Pseudomonadota bacterium]